MLTRHVPRKPKICQLENTFVADQNVCRFHVTMQNTSGMNAKKTVEQMLHHTLDVLNL